MPLTNESSLQKFYPSRPRAAIIVNETLQMDAHDNPLLKKNPNTHRILALISVSIVHGPVTVVTDRVALTSRTIALQVTVRTRPS